MKKIIYDISKQFVEAEAVSRIITYCADFQKSSIDLISPLQDGVKGGDNSVHNTFYHDEAVNIDSQVASFMKEFSIKYTCFLISTVPSHDFNKTVQNCDYNSLIATLLNANNYFLGSYYFSKKIKADISKIFSNSEPILGDLSKTLITKPCMNGLAELAVFGSNGSDVVKFLILLIKSLDVQNQYLPDILSVWQSDGDLWALACGFDEIDWCVDAKSSFKQDQTSYQALIDNVRNAIGHSEEDSIGIPMEGIDIYSIYYGGNVLEWLNSGLPAQYGLRSDSNPNNYRIKKPSDSGGCVIAGTLITLAAGKLKPVEQIVQGDLLITGKAGSVSEASSELVMTPNLLSLYSVNDDEPFMSFDHVIMSQRGWVSLDPRKSMAYSPHLSVKRLHCGDVIWKFKNGRIFLEVVRKIRTFPSFDANHSSEELKVDERTKGGNHLEVVRKLKSNEVVKAPIESFVMGFDVHTRGGHPSYIANGYVCLMSYPEITAQRICANALTNLSSIQRAKLVRNLMDTAPLLDAALGEGVLPAVLQALNSPTLIASRGIETLTTGIKKPVFFSSEHYLIPHMVSYDKAGSVTRFSLIRGTLFVNGNPVPTHITGNKVMWSRVQQHNRQVETGVIRLYSSGLFAQGLKQVDGKRTKLLLESDLKYMVTINNPPDGVDTLWYDFHLGMKNHAPFGNICDRNDSSNLIQSNTKVVFSESKNSVGVVILSVSIQIDANFCAFGGSIWISAMLDFLPDFSTFTGSVVLYDEKAKAYQGNAYSVRGRYSSIASPINLTHLLNLQTNLHLYSGPQLSHLESPSESNAHPHIAAHSEELSSISSALDGDLSLLNLFSLPPPDLNILHETSFGKMKALMLLAISSDWLKYFGETRPSVGPGQVLTQSDAELLNDSAVKDFLINQFARGYLTQAFSKSSDTNITDQFNGLDTENKLAYFWKGDGATSFSKLPAYSTASNTLLISTYKEMVPELLGYLHNDPTNWARQLYIHCVTEPTLTGLALNNTLDGKAKLSNLCSILTALDPNSSAVVLDPTTNKGVPYAVALQSRIMDVFLSNITSSSIATENMYNFLITFFEQYFNSLLVGGSWQDAIRQEGAKELQDLMAELHTTTVEQTINAIEDTLTVFVSYMTEQIKLPFQARLARWAKAYPKVYSCVARTLAMGAYGFAIMWSLQAFQNWDSLTTQDKVMAVGNVIGTTLSMFNDFTAWKSAGVLTRSTSTIAELQYSSLELANMGKLKTLTNVCNDVAIRADASLAEIRTPWAARATQTQFLEEELMVTRWTRIANVAEVFAKGFSIALLAAGCVVSGLQIKDDFSSGQPPAIKALDILSEVSMGVAFLASAGTLMAGMLAAEVLTVVPVIGEVAAIVGVVIAVVSMFIHRDPPPTPAEQFVTDNSVPFVKGLSSPPQEWLDDQTKLNNHLEGKGKK